MWLQQAPAHFYIISWRRRPCKVTNSVADPGAVVFLTPGSGMGKKSRSRSGMNIPYHISESLKQLCDVDPDPGSFWPWIRDRKIRIRDKKKPFPKLFGFHCQKKALVFAIWFKKNTLVTKTAQAFFQPGKVQIHNNSTANMTGKKTSWQNGL